MAAWQGMAAVPSRARTRRRSTARRPTPPARPPKRSWPPGSPAAARCRSPTPSARPAAIIDRLRLRRPIYRKTAAYGHFGRPEKEFAWEQVDDLADDLRRAAA